MHDWSCISVCAFTDLEEENLLYTPRHVLTWELHLRPVEWRLIHSNSRCSEVTSCQFHLELPGLTHSRLCFIHGATTDPPVQQLSDRESFRWRPVVLSFGFCLITHSWGPSRPWRRHLKMHRTAGCRHPYILYFMIQANACKTVTGVKTELKALAFVYLHF